MKLDEDNFNIMKLDEDNFILWKSQIIPTLRGHDLEKFILSRGPMVKKNTDLEVDKSEGGRDMSINEFWLNMKTIADNLEAAVEFVHETYFTFYILEGLGLEFDLISENLNSRLDLINLTEVSSRLLAYENKLEEYNIAITINIGSNHSKNITSVAAKYGMNYVLGQSSNANSKNLSANPVGLSVSFLESLNFNAAVSNSQHNHSLDNFMRHVKFPSNIGFHFANNNQTYSPNSQRFVQDIRGSKGYNIGYNNRGRALQRPNPSSFLTSMQSGFPLNSASTMSFTPTLFQFQPQLGVQGQFGHGSQMLAGSFGPSNGTQVVSQVSSMYSNALVSPGYSNALVSPGNFMLSAQPNNMVGQNVIGPNGFGHFPSSQLPVRMLANLTSYNVPSAFCNHSALSTASVNTQVVDLESSNVSDFLSSLSKSTFENVVPPASTNPDTLNGSTPNFSIVTSQNLITSSPISSPSHVVSHDCASHSPLVAASNYDMSKFVSTLKHNKAQQS
ncbi:hypothetical protein FEM48_Zijuj10G0096000 [Ziziphus jujuba var. spinosa]|uniref:Uncharacterized protein n=1 Tax=Ziziphus jujuba var. spinosa TaxID=714518 RepID=A0A978UMM1_ZIZJJ|nr:hypothetical protein FEM48_Zijuj10G0096000 [Ziziphus jujuba var. spinosa]